MNQIEELNGMDLEEFVDVLGEVFENTPAIARRIWAKRPFTDGADLHQQMMHEVEIMGWDEKLALLRAHPDLGSRAKMAAASVQEQAGVGFDRLTAEESQQLLHLNQAYQEKFGFPFIAAVRGQTQANVLAGFRTRLENSIEAERQRAIEEIGKITRLRLAAMGLQAQPES
jgi:2-oxo-4-hydroxy-4-carboxy-5-ureidoimidazoline decarboxylase